jgi:plasmid stabilization system protein ParE
MAELIWTEPALNDLDAVADYIAVDKPTAARQFVHRVFSHVEQLKAHPESGSTPKELSGSRYQQIVEPPCRIIYRYDGQRVFVVLVFRGEMRLQKSMLTRRERQVPPGT